MSSSSRDFSGIVSKLGLQPMEAPSMVSNKKAKLYIGIPKERSFQEHRIAITPESVRVLTANGHRIVIEENAGKESRFYDNDYSEAGAEIVADEEAVYKADIILKVAPPLPYEIALMKMNQTLISPLHIPSIKQEYIEMLMKKRITALAYEYTKDDAGFFP
ncbi:MAG TPA: alanine dehydrogenase, partial [Chitinophagales bacterium]|nr:alanine dehydrogenase [Chitinophagales bacterium]